MVHAEVILQRNRRLGLRGLLHLYVLLCLDRLVETIGVAATVHDTTGLLVDDHHLIVDHDILVVSIEEGVGLEQLLDGMDTLTLDRVIGQQLVLSAGLLLLAHLLILQLRHLGGNIG